MPAVDRDFAYLWDMLDSARSACEFTAGVRFDAYQRDRKLQLAVERGWRSSGRLPAGFPTISAMPTRKFPGAV